MSDDGLKEFLTSRRAAISPDSVGLPVSMTSRRVAGLRREEVAILAGVSVDYYTKFEQGRALNISEQVLESIERALQLSDLERRHLRSLLRPESRIVASESTPRPKARAAVITMIHSLGVPAIVHGPLLEILAINDVARALFDDFPAMPIEHRNLVRWMFLNPRAREVYLDWDRHASEMTAILRAAANGPRTDALDRLVGELTIESPDFKRFWNEYKLYEHTHGLKRFGNEIVGELHLHYETLPLVGERGQTIVVYSADPGSASEEKLQLLSSWVSRSSDASGVQVES